MTSEMLTLTFFLVMLGAITAIGYFFVLRPAGSRNEGAVIPADIAIAEPVNSGVYGVFINTFRRMGDAIPGSHSDTNPLRKRLVAAGYRWPGALPIFYGIKCASAVLLGVITLWASAFFLSEASFIGAICLAAFGYMAPDIILNRLARARGQRLRSALPAALDLMVLSIESGQSLDQAILDTSRALKTTSPDLSAELTLMHLELRASNSRADSIRAFADRNDEPELRKVSNLLIDTDRFGTSLGPALRTHSRYMRIRFRQQAQEKARKLGVKLIFPVFFLIFPAVLLVTLGPAVILLFTQMQTMVNSF